MRWRSTAYRVSGPDLATLDGSSQSEVVHVLGEARLESIYIDDGGAMSLEDLVLAGSSSPLGVQMNMSVAADTTVSLSSSDPSILAVPATVVVQEFSSFQDVIVKAARPDRDPHCHLRSPTATQVVSEVAMRWSAVFSVGGSPVVGRPFQGVRF